MITESLEFCVAFQHVSVDGGFDPPHAVLKVSHGHAQFVVVTAPLSHGVQSSLLAQVGQVGSGKVGAGGCQLIEIHV